MSETIFRLGPETYRPAVPPAPRARARRNPFAGWQDARAEDCERGNPYRATACGRPMRRRSSGRLCEIRSLLVDGSVRLCLIALPRETT
jgi:hypothetical protein